MRSFTIAALLGSAVACASLTGQSLTEHAAAAAGGTIGTAAGKTLSPSLGHIFGNVDKTSSKVAGAKGGATSKTAKPLAQKPSPTAPAGKTDGKTEGKTDGKTDGKTEHTATVGVTPSGASTAPGGEGGRSAHRAARRERETIEAEAPIPAPVIPIVAEPVLKEPTPQELDGIKIGTPGNELRSVLGTPESMVSIPDDDGHLRETLQYWSHGEPIGTVRLDNGRVVSVQTNR
jgi:hypothetical protein